MTDNFSLNSAQIKGLANFFFDIAKGFVLGGVGLTAAYPIEEKFVLNIISISLAIVSLRIALRLLEEVKE